MVYNYADMLLSEKKNYADMLLHYLQTHYQINAIKPERMGNNNASFACGNKTY